MKDYLKTLSFAGLFYIANAVVLLLFFCLSDWGSLKSLLFAFFIILSYSFLYVVPALVVAGIALLILLRMKNVQLRNKIVHGVLVASAFVTVQLLLFDLGLYRGWGFHFNPLVYNLLTTPGGFASMGLRTSSVIPLVLGILLVAGVFSAAGVASWRSNLLQKAAEAVFKPLRAAVIAVVIILSFATNLLWYGYESYMMKPELLETAEVVPLYIPVSMKSLLKDMGVKAPERHEILMQNTSANELQYPAKKISRNGVNKKYNVIWLACESWRGDMLNEKVMPNAWKMSQKALRFTNHYSGGNGTRMGVFSMFYGLYGNYWHPVLRSSRGPVFLDWLLEDGYKFFCITSAKFTYPEFDHTVFAKIKSEHLFSDDKGLTWERDRRNVKRLCDFIAENSKKGPFFSFMFFESPHAPYEFPAENELEKDYPKTINYASVSKADGPALKRRYMNSCNHLDSRLAEVFSTIEKCGLQNNTIVVLVGDHGEEFFEKGRLGHNSTFSREQLHTPLMIYIPGVAPGTYDKMSSHLDIVPMLAPYFGVTSPAEDYSLGYNLLDGKSERNYSVVSSWNELFFVGKQHKILLPTTSVSAATTKLYDINDNVVEGKDKFFSDNVSTLMKIQIDSQRFNK